MSLEERTLVVRNFDPNQTTKELLEELFSNFGPIQNVVLKQTFAYIGYTDVESVSYALAMMNDICLHGRRLRLHPKLEERVEYYKYLDYLKRFEYESNRSTEFLEKFLNPEQKKLKEKMVSEFARSKGKRISIRNRLEKIRRHYDPPNDKLNPYFGFCLESSGGGHDNNNDNYDRHHHHRNGYDNNRTNDRYRYDDNNRRRYESSPNYNQNQQHTNEIFHHSNSPYYHQGPSPPPPPPPPVAGHGLLRQPPPPPSSSYREESSRSYYHPNHHNYYTQQNQSQPSPQHHYRNNGSNRPNHHHHHQGHRNRW